MQQLNDRVFTETKVRGCNPSFVVTSAGPVVIDTPQLPTRAVEMRRFVETFGEVQYLINTEHHVDHIFGNYYFRGAGAVVNHKGLYDNFMTVYPELDPFEYAREALATDDPDGVALFPDRDEYYEDPNKGQIVFTGDLSLRVGQHDFHLLHTPGHTPGQLAVYVPQERMVFTGDSVFCECQTWLMTSDVDQWLASLEIIRSLDVDTVVPGHGPVTDLSYVDKQRAALLSWKAAVAEAVAAGWTKEETQARVKFPTLGPVDIGQEYMLEYVETLNAGSLFDKFAARRAAPVPPRSS
ncbi:MBL fold metallo-hydrolase [Geodermatophilus sp. SYSU D00779]